MAAMQYSTGVRDAMMNQLETTIGATPLLKLRTGAKPTNCGTADSGTVLLDLTLPTDWLTTASGDGVKSLQSGAGGSWSGTASGGGGTVGHFRIYDSTGTTCHIQGDVTATSGGGAMELDNVVLSDGQTVTITAFTLTAGGA